ncbi:unnamed protein product, partial [Urochloa humidicola]
PVSSSTPLSLPLPPPPLAPSPARRRPSRSCPRRRPSLTPPPAATPPTADARRLPPSTPLDAVVAPTAGFRRHRRCTRPSTPPLEPALPPVSTAGFCGGGVVLDVVVYLNDHGHGQGRCNGEKARTPGGAAARLPARVFQDDQPASFTVLGHGGWSFLEGDTRRRNHIFPKHLLLQSR